MPNIYAEITGPGTAALHMPLATVELLIQGICRVHSEFPSPCPENWKGERANLVQIKVELEDLLKEAAG